MTSSESAGAYWSAPLDEVRGLVTAPDGGLTSEAAGTSLGRWGPNELAHSRQLTGLRLLARQFVNPIELVLVGATVLAGILGDWTDCAIILSILVLSGLLGFIQEQDAGRAVRALLSGVQATCAVRRDGQLVRLPISAVVPGDEVHVAAGDLVPGDGIVVKSNNLSVDQSALTGETFPVEKRPGAVDASTPLRFRSNLVYLGSHVASGTGVLLLVRTGRATEMAAIAERLSGAAPRTSFEKGMTRFGLLLSRAMLVLVIVIFIVNLILQRPPLDAALFALALAVGLTPQLLPAIVAIGLAQGARAMAQKHVIVRRLDAIEDLGGMTVLCCDKTGTMTEGRIELGGAYSVDGDSSTTVADLAALNAGLQTGWENPLDLAILEAHPLPSGTESGGELPFDFHRKRQSVCVRMSPGERPLLITKGALEAVLSVCTRVSTGGTTQPISNATSLLEQALTEWSRRGFRVLGLATRELDHDNPVPADESHMTFMGILTFADSVKPDAAQTVRDLTSAGISVRMLTGDNRQVACSVASKVGLDTSAVLVGTDIDAMHDVALARGVEDVQVFADLTPVQKERIVRAFREAGHGVGFLGDGINDAPPLHAADVGFTVDSAVPVAKEAAAVVLLDKSLSVLLEGVRQGRRTFANTMKYIFVSTSASFGNMLSMAVASALLPFLPLLAGQILVINLLSDLPATMIATDAVDEDQLKRPQRWDIRLIRVYMIVFGTLSSVFDLMTFALLRLVFHAQAPEFRSAWMLGSILTEVGILFVLRTRGPFYRSRPARGLIISSALVVIVTVWLPFSPLAPALRLVPVPVPLLAAIGVVTVAYLAANELLKRWFWAWEDPRALRAVQRRLDQPSARLRSSSKTAA